MSILYIDKKDTIVSIIVKIWQKTFLSRFWASARKWSWYWLHCWRRLVRCFYNRIQGKRLTVSLKEIPILGLLTLEYWINFAVKNSPNPKSFGETVFRYWLLMKKTLETEKEHWQLMSQNIDFLLYFQPKFNAFGHILSDEKSSLQSA